MDTLPDESLSLHLASLHDEELEFTTRLTTSLLTEFPGLHPWYLDEYIDTIEYRSREPRAILVDRQWRTGTWLLRISHVSTGTWVHRTDERESCRISTRLIDTIDRDLSVFKWLAERLEERLIEFEELIEEEDSLMGE